MSEKLTLVAGDQFYTYFGGPYTVLEVRERVKITGIKKDKNIDPHRTVILYETNSGDTGTIQLGAISRKA